MAHYRLGKVCRAAVVWMLASLTGYAWADEIQWQGDPARAWKSASESGRPLFIFATMEGCVHCRRMEQGTFSDSTVQSHVNERFVPVYMPLDRHEQLIERWKINTFPTTLLVAPSGVVLVRIKGFTSADELLRQSRAALQNQSAIIETAKAKSDTTRR